LSISFIGNGFKAAVLGKNWLFALLEAIKALSQEKPLPYPRFI
jgi:hypothetical protein